MASGGPGRILRGKQRHGQDGGGALAQKGETMMGSVSRARNGSRVRGRVLAGILAGAFAGLAGSAAKIASEAVYPPRTLGQTPPPVVLAERVAGHPLSSREQLVSMEAIHWVFGAASGAVYGGVGEVVPLVRIGYGIVFGLVLQLCTHESAVPLLGLDKPPGQQPLREHESEFLSHAVYGLATEMVRRVIRRRLKPPPLEA